MVSLVFALAVLFCLLCLCWLGILFTIPACIIGGMISGWLTQCQLGTVGGVIAGFSIAIPIGLHCAFLDLHWFISLLLITVIGGILGGLIGPLIAAGIQWIETGKCFGPS